MTDGPGYIMSHAAVQHFFSESLFYFTKHASSTTRMYSALTFGAGIGAAPIVFFTANGYATLSRGLSPSGRL